MQWSHNNPLFPLMAWSRVLVVGATVLLGGCGPYLEPYRYIRLDDAPGLSQSSDREPDLEGLYFAGTMPSGYRLDRPDYEMTFTVPMQSYLPALQVSVATPGLEIRPKESESPPSPVFCGTWYPDPGNRRQLNFGWSSKCADGRPEQFSIVVTDESGSAVGEETVSFRLERNGWLILADAI